MRSSALRRSSASSWSGNARSSRRSTPDRTRSWRRWRSRWTPRSWSSLPALARPRTWHLRSAPTSVRTAWRSCRRGTRCRTRGWIRRPRWRPGGPMRSDASAERRDRSSSWPPTWPRCRRSHRPSAPLGPCSSRQAWRSHPTPSRNDSRSSGTPAWTWWSTEASSPSGAGSSTCSRASPGARRGSSTGATRSSASASSPPRRSCPRSSSARSRSRPSVSSCPTRISARSPRPEPRACPTVSATACNGWPTGSASRGPTRSHRSCSIGCRCPPSCSRPGAGWP